MKSDFTNKKAFVVGGTGGIGKTVAQALAATGANVTVLGRNPLADLSSLKVDLDTPEGQKKALEQVQNADILCYARGPFLQKPLHETNEQQWHYIIEQNFFLPGLFVSKVLPHQMQNNWGRIFLFGGTRTNAIQGFKTNPVYGAAKTALSSLVRSVALSYAEYGITCNAICPGFVDTEYLSTEQKELLAKKNPDGQLILAEEIAEICVSMMYNTVYNGVILPLDKGWAP